MQLTFICVEPELNTFFRIRLAIDCMNLLTLDKNENWISVLLMFSCQIIYFCFDFRGIFWEKKPLVCFLSRLFNLPEIPSSHFVKILIMCCRACKEQISVLRVEDLLFFCLWAKEKLLKKKLMLIKYLKIGGEKRLEYWELQFSISWFWQLTRDEQRVVISRQNMPNFYR